jgi:hypothetical protein
MTVSNLTLIEIKDSYQELNAFLKPDQYTIETFNPYANLLTLRKPITEQQRLLLTIWVEANRWRDPYAGIIIG